jgi:glycosyltransferase involved in cell wall biosynthesis
VVKRVNRYYGRDSLLVYPPVILSQNESFDLETPREYFLVVNALVPYKNTHLAVQACTELNLPLKVVGSGPDLSYLSKIGGPSIEFLGQVSDQSLIELYLGAKALIFCAEEDFGIVPLEANSHGTPVIFYGKGGLAETQIEGERWTGVSFKKLDTESLKISMQDFLRKESLLDRKFCKENAHRFSLDRFKKEIMDVVNASLN